MNGTQSPSVHAATVPAGALGIIAGFFLGRLFGPVIAIGICAVVLILAIIAYRRGSSRREPLMAGAGALTLGTLGILLVAYLNFS